MPVSKIMGEWANLRQFVYMEGSFLTTEKEGNCGVDASVVEMETKICFSESEIEGQMVYIIKVGAQG